jgi:hypothetical protein
MKPSRTPAKLCHGCAERLHRLDGVFRLAGA